MSVERLHPDDLAALAALLADHVAERVVERLAEANARHVAHSESALVDATTVAAALGVHRDTVYEHADRLGARRLGDGPRARMRFDLGEAVAAWTSRGESGASRRIDAAAGAGDRPRRLPSRSGTPLDFAPVPDVQPRPTSRKAAGRRWSAPGPATGESASPRQQPNPQPAGSAVDARLIPRRPKRKGNQR